MSGNAIRAVSVPHRMSWCCNGRLLLYHHLSMNLSLRALRPVAVPALIAGAAVDQVRDRVGCALLGT